MPKRMLEPFQPADADSGRHFGDRDAAGSHAARGSSPPWTINGWLLRKTMTIWPRIWRDSDSFAAQASADTRKVFDTNDLVIWSNVPKLSAGLDKTLDDFQTEATGMLELTSVTNNQGPLAGAMQKEAVGMVFSFVKEFLKDARSSMITARLTDSGATLGLVGDFVPDSSIGKFIAAQKTGRPISFQGLPTVTGNNFLIAGSFNWDSTSVAAQVGNAIDQLLSDDVIAKDTLAPDMKSYADLAKQLLADATGMRMILLDPPAGGKGGIINGAVLIDTPDSAKFMKLDLEMLNSGLIKSSVFQQATNPDLKQTITTVPDAVTIKGVKLTKMNMKFTLREETPDKPIVPANKAALEAILKMYGPDGLTTYIGAVGKQVLIVYGSEGPLLEAAVAAAQANTDTFSSNPAIAATKDQLVANPIAVFYQPITRWVTLAQSIMSPSPAADAPASPAIVNAPPIISSLGVTGSMLTAELHVPIATISGMQEAIMRIQREMNGPQGGPPPSPLP